jgi:starch synthase
LAKQIKVLHVSAECYPAAKNGGLADVVGALPKYLAHQNMYSGVVIPKYYLPWVLDQTWEEQFRGSIQLGYEQVYFVVQKESTDVLGFPFYVIDIPGKFDRPGVYADPSGFYYRDDADRFICFQQAVLKWLSTWEIRPEILHCHDHHSGLIPFMIKYCPEYQHLSHVPTVFTIHNGRYHGAFGWDMSPKLPYFSPWVGGMIEWSGAINPLAAGIKCSWYVTTVSNSYLDELKWDSKGLEWLFNEEWYKSAGILNGIDTAEWDPQTDEKITCRLKKSVDYFKRKNKEPLLETFNLEKDRALIAFIGRFASEKGADILPGLVYSALSQDWPISILILGSGDPDLQNELNSLISVFEGRFNTYIGYNESLAHQIYAGADFLLMPSRVEPCGLNQMYAMRYGTLPIVRRTGGLKDTVIDFGDENGRGILFNHVTIDDMLHAIWRGVTLFKDKKQFKSVRDADMALDFSWEKSAKSYKSLYGELIKSK